MSLQTILIIFFRYYQKRMGVHKLIIFIDGLDEIPYSTNSTIADIIPSPDSLDKGIYFIFYKPFSNR